MDDSFLPKPDDGDLDALMANKRAWNTVLALTQNFQDELNAKSFLTGDMLISLIAAAMCFGRRLGQADAAAASREAEALVNRLNGVKE